MVYQVLSAFSILDDIEMYEHQKPFTVEDYFAISSFLNNFVFRVIWNNLIGKKLKRNI